jgi:ribonuclease HII
LTLIAGIDDAGRGPVIGPLVIAGILIQDHQVPVLDAIGARDSKALTPRRRSSLAKQIQKIAVKYKIVELSPREIDEVVLNGRRLRRLNWLEAQAMAEVIQGLHPDVAYVDASDVREKRFGEHIHGMLSFDVEIVSEHHADAKYPVVSAASIIAKTHRDEVIAGLRKICGDFGSGYSSDPKTRQFLRDWFRDHGDQELPDFVRRSWKTIGKIKKEVEQTQAFSEEG